jgi:hypothetical protein|tara:strand:+ start:79 stop:654 length:576 start_codon:yes stop_codon:yes gene_type:complete
MDYKIYQSSIISKHHNSFLKNCYEAKKLIQTKFNTNDTTWCYNKYNLLSLTSSSVLFYKMYKELNHNTREFIGDDRPLWIQSWLNYHIDDNHLQNSLGYKKGFHGHQSCYHGYISIDPQNTITKFRNGLEIENKIGQIYIGPGNKGKKLENNSWDHYVDIITPSPSPRITIAFDIITTQNVVNHHYFIPLL